MYTLVTLIACSGAGDQATADTDSVPLDTGSTPLDTVSSTWHPDADGDGFGSSAITVESAEAPANHVADGTDCDDADPTVNPAATETCDGRDEDCDGDIDEGFPLWYPDSDGDGWGEEAAATSECDAPSGYIETGGDCDDTDPLVSPGAEEVCDDGIDDDCDGWDSRCRLEGTISLADAEARYLGDNAGDVAGDALACGGDTNGDGVPELLIGETERYRWDFLGKNAVGGAWLVSSLEAGTHDLDQDAAISLWGDVDGWYYDSALTFLSDPLGDGYDGVIIGSREENAAYVYYGPITAPMLPPDADAVIVHSDSYLRFGECAIDLGEGAFLVTGSGSMSDASGDRLDVGKAFLFTEPVSGTAHTADAQSTFAPHRDNERGYFGKSICGTDLDGDGVKDLVIGLPSFYPFHSYPDFMEGGAVYVLYGPFEGDLNVASDDGALIDADARIESTWQAGGFGYEVSCDGDTNADGLPDLLVGAADYTPGYAFLFRRTLTGVVDASSADGVVEIGQEEGYELGVSLKADLDSDGRSDVVLASGYRDAAYLFYGGVSGAVGVESADVTFESEGNYASTTAGCPDMNGDGVDDLLIGATHESTNGQYSGAAYLILGGGG